MRAALLAVKIGDRLAAEIAPGDPERRALARDVRVHVDVGLLAFDRVRRRRWHRRDACGNKERPKEAHCGVRVWRTNRSLRKRLTALLSVLLGVSMEPRLGKTTTLPVLQGCLGTI